MSLSRERQQSLGLMTGNLESSSDGDVIILGDSSSQRRTVSHGPL